MKTARGEAAAQQRSNEGTKRGQNGNQKSETRKRKAKMGERRAEARQGKSGVKPPQSKENTARGDARPTGKGKTEDRELKIEDRK